jgi:hypothetical protein
MTNTTALNLTASFIDAIDDIVAKRIRWEQGTYAAANVELYSILGDCLDLFIAIKRNTSAAKAVDAVLKVRKIAFNNATSLELKLVRLVFATADTANPIKNRLFSYARVIRIAAQANQSGQTLAKFITDNHGIDEIRRANSEGVKAEDKVKQQLELAQATLTQSSEYELFSNFALPDQLQPKDGQQFSLALVRKNADGTGSIVFGTNNVTAVSTVMALAGKEIQESAVKAAEVQSAKQVQAVKQQNLAELEAVMSEAIQAKQHVFKPQITLSNSVAVPA